MKKMVIITLTALMALPTFAQYRPGTRGPGYRRPAPVYNSRPSTNRYHSYYNDVYYGLRLGFDVSTVNSESRYLNGGSTVSGLGLGGYVGFQISPTAPLYLETGLEYKEKGGKGIVDGTKFSYSLNYLELPIVAKYKIYLDRYTSIQPFAGGYMACGITGKVKDYMNRIPEDSYNDKYFKRFDGGLRLGCGIEYQMLYAELGYDLGLSNIGQDDFDTTHNRCFFVNIGINF